MVKPAGIDVHAHFFPETFIRAVEEAGAAFGVSALRYLVATVGADRAMQGTDFCFDMGLERPLAIIQAKATGLSRKDQERVVRSNAARMLHLE